MNNGYFFVRFKILGNFEEHQGEIIIQHKEMAGINNANKTSAARET